MGVVEILVIIFIVLKLVGVIAWSWVMVFMPMIAMYGTIAVVYIIMCIAKVCLEEE